MLLSRLYQRTSEAVTRALGGETVVIPVGAGIADLESIFVLNDTAAVVWDALARAATVGDLASRVSSEFSVDVADAERDVRELIADLEGAGLVASREPAPPTGGGRAE